MAITFDSIGNGGLREEFDMTLRQIGRNILNPNMDETAAREMIISIKFKPSGPGKMNVTYNVKSKLAGFRKSETMFLIGQDSSTGRIDMSEPGSGFQQVSQFVFRIGDRGTPEFKLVEAEGGIWKTEAVRKIKDYLELVLSEQDMALRNRITIIG